LNADNLKKVMESLDFSSADVATVTGVTRRTVQLWMAGAPIPLSAGIVLEGILEGLLPMEWVEDKIILAMRIA
jgi:predicted transcriptional regulator